ncbi:MAG: helix-turn-helix domain-containing protein [Ruminococcus sp.]|nr:helix-turn-helix domain-containing protein [Ruminococcus sp.]
MNSKDNEKLLVTPAEACQLLGVGRTTMYAWIKKGLYLW